VTQALQTIPIFYRRRLTGATGESGHPCTKGPELIRVSLMILLDKAQLNR
jgi:hypothetical protein